MAKRWSEISVTLTFDHKIQLRSSLSPNGHVIFIQKKFLRCSWDVGHSDLDLLLWPPKSRHFISECGHLWFICANSLNVFLKWQKLENGIDGCTYCCTHREPENKMPLATSVVTVETWEQWSYQFFLHHKLVLCIQVFVWCV